MSTLLGEMVKQNSCTVITFFQWISFPSVLCHSLKFSSIEGLCVSSVPEPEQSVTLGHHISEESFTHFAASSLSGYSWSYRLVWKPCLSTLHPGSRHLAPMSSGYSCRPLLGQGTYFRHMKIQIGLSCPKHAGTHCLALHCCLNARF